MEKGKERPFLSEAHLEEDLLARGRLGMSSGCQAPCFPGPGSTRSLPHISYGSHATAHCLASIFPIVPGLPVFSSTFHNQAPLSFLSRAVTALWAQPFQHLAESAVTPMSERFVSHLQH